MDDDHGRDGTPIRTRHHPHVLDVGAESQSGLNHLRGQLSSAGQFDQILQAIDKEQVPIPSRDNMVSAVKPAVFQGLRRLERIVMVADK